MSIEMVRPARCTTGTPWTRPVGRGLRRMDYTPDPTEFRNLVERQQQWAGRVPCYPGIGLSCWSTPGDVVTLIEQIGITRALKTGGFTVFELDTQAAGVLPLCALGATRP